MKKNLSILAYQESCDYYKIGGMESFIRRIGRSLSLKTYNVKYIFYGNKKKQVALSNSEKIYYTSFAEALEILKDENFVLTVYLRKKDRQAFNKFVSEQATKTKFVLIQAGVIHNIKSLLAQMSYFRTITSGGILSLPPLSENRYQIPFIKYNCCLPPVPEKWFISPDKKVKNSKIKMAFIGRIDANKGIESVIQISEKLKYNEKIELSVYGYLGHGSFESTEFHNKLNAMTHIRYIRQKWDGWNPTIDESLQEILKETDIVLLPYVNFKGTIEPPLLLLESMAASCVVFTIDISSVKSIYGESPYLISPKTIFAEYVVNFFTKQSEDCLLSELHKERFRVYERIMSLGCQTDRCLENIENAFR